MKPISSADDLKQAIAELEKKKTIQESVIKDQYGLAKEALKPANLLKNTYSRVAGIPEVRKTLINTIVGFGLGYFSKKAATFLSEKSLDNMVTRLVDYSADHMIEKKPDSLISKGIHFARNAVKENILVRY